MRIMSERVAQQIIKILADSRIEPDQWRYWIPQHITEENLRVIANAKQLADGIIESIAENEIGLPAHLMLDYTTRHEVDR